jgi:hypothetical protein
VVKPLSNLASFACKCNVLRRENEEYELGRRNRSSGAFHPRYVRSTCLPVTGRDEPSERQSVEGQEHGGDV